MPKKRLNRSHRGLLKELVTQKIQAPNQKAEMANAHADALNQTLKHYNNQFPKEEMKILSKYGLIDEVNNLRIHAKNDAEGKHEHLSIDLNHSVIIPKKYFVIPNASAVAIPFDGRCHKAILKFNQKEKDYIKAIDAIKQDYYTLINASYYFEDVIDIWDEAEELRSQICNTGTGLIALSNTVKQRIIQDSSKRKQDTV